MTIEVAAWRTSSFSSGGDCVAVAQLPDGTIGIHDSKNPEAGMLRLAPEQMAAWIAGIKAGEYDDLVSGH